MSNRRQSWTQLFRSSALSPQMGQSEKQSPADDQIQFNIETLEPRMMLNADLGNLVFVADFEDAAVESGEFAFFNSVSGLSTTGRQVEVQNNHPSVGPASQGDKHLELDGVSGVFVDVATDASQDLLLRFDYSPRPGVTESGNAIEVWWDGSLLRTVARDGGRSKSTDFELVEIELESPSKPLTRLEFRSDDPTDTIGLGGLIDNIRVNQIRGELELNEIADQEIVIGDELDLIAALVDSTAAKNPVFTIEGPEGISIDPVSGQIRWTASAANVENSDEFGGGITVGDSELVFEAGFEDVDVAEGGFAFFAQLSGFTSVIGGVEVQNNHPSVGPASQGTQHVELDGQNAIFREIETVEGDQYELTFDYSARPGVDEARNEIELWWGDRLLDTVSADGDGLRTTDFRQFSFDLSEFSGDLNRLEFRSNDPIEQVGLGGLIDNIRLHRRTVEVIDGEEGKFEVTVTVTDGDGRTDTETFLICVEDVSVNLAPVFEPVPDQAINEGQEFSMVLQANDPESDQLTYSLVQFVAGDIIDSDAEATAARDSHSEFGTATVDPVSGEFLWTPTELAGPGDYSFLVRVEDTAGNSDTDVFKLIVMEVNESPVLADIPDQSVLLGDTVSLTATGSDVDIPPNELTFTLTDDAPDGAEIDPITGLFRWTPDESFADQTTAITVILSDGRGGSDSKSFDIAVVSVNEAPILEPIADQVIDEGRILNLFAVATDDPAQELTYSMLEGPEGATVNPNTGRFRFAPTEADGPGNYDVTIQVEDSLGLTATTSFIIAVNEVNVAPVIDPIENVMIGEGDTVTLIATGSDADLPANELTFRLGQNAPDDASINPTTGEFRWVHSGLVEADETVTVEVILEDGAGGSDSTTFDITILQGNRAPIIQPISRRRIDEGESANVLVSATDDPTQTLTYSLSTDSPEAAVINPETGRFRFETTEADGPGTFEVTVIVTDNLGAFSTTSFEVIVNEVNLAPVLSPISNGLIAPDQTFFANALATDPDLPANDLVFSFDAAPETASIDPESGAIEYSSAGLGVFDFVVRVSDGELSDTTNFSVEVTQLDCLFERDEISFSQMGGSAGSEGMGQHSGCGVVLTEGSSFETTASVSFIVPDSASSFVFDYEDLMFDQRDAGSINDAFEVALLGSDGNSVVQTIGNGQDAFFNVSEPNFSAAGVNTQVDGNRVSVDLSNLNSGDEVTLVFRLVNNDGDEATTVKITPVEFGDGFNSPIGAILPGRTTSDATIDFPSLTNVTGSLEVNYGTSSFNAADSTLFANVDFKNLANHPIDGPFVLAVSGITDPTVALSRPDGTTPDGDRFYVLNGPSGLDTLAPGASTIPTSLEFFNPSGNQFGFELNIWAQPNIAPEFVTSPVTEGTAGRAYAYDSDATDEDNDELTYLLMTGPQGLTINPESGELNWSPTSEDIGTHSVMVEVLDGRGGIDVQQYDIEVLLERPNRPPVIVSTPVVETVLAGRVNQSVDEQATTQNLIQNGDFSQGNVGFDSDLPNNQTNITGVSYAVVADPGTVHPLATSYPDRSGDGLMLAVNGSLTFGDVVWEQTVDVAPNTNYDFATYVSSWFPDSPAELEFAINGETIGELTAPSDTGVWELAFATWNSGNAEQAVIQIRNANLAFSGNDFALDDIYFGNSLFSEIASRFIELTPTDVGSAIPNVFDILPSENPSVFGFHGDVRSINFDTDALGNPIANGAFLTTEFESLGVVLNEIQVSDNVFGGPASSPNTTFTPAIPGEGLVFQFTAPMQAVGFINTSPDQDMIEFFDSEGELIFSTIDQEGGAIDFTVDRFIGFTASEDRPIHSMRVSNNSGNLELDELIFVPVQASYEYQVEAVDPDLDPVAFTLDQSPEAMIINRDTGLISWTPTGQQVGVHTIVVTASDGRGGTATQEYQLRVLADPTNTSPVIVSEPVDNFFIPGTSNPASGDVSPQRISLDLGNGQSFEGTVSITLPNDSARFADIVLAVDESGSMAGDQAWVAEMIPLLDAALIDAGIGSDAAFPNRFGIIGFGGGRDGITVGHFLNSERRSKYSLYGPDNEVVAEGFLNDVVPDELLNLQLPDDGQYVLVVEPQNEEDLADGINIGVRGDLRDGVVSETLELNTMVDGILNPGQPVEYSFQVNETSLIYFDSLAKDNRLQRTLRGPDGVAIGGESVNFDLGHAANNFVYQVGPGNYTLLIDSNVDVAADYQFQILDLSESTQVASGVNVVGEFVTKTETLAYRISAEAGKLIRLVNSTAGVHSGSQWRLIGPNGELIARNSIGANQNPIEIIETGEYYLLMESAFSPKEGISQLRQPSTFEFTLDVLDPTPPIEIIFGDVVEGALEYANQFIGYTFTLDERALVYLDSLANSGLTWTLDGPQGTVVNGLRFDLSDSFNNLNPVLDLVAGEYSLRVEGTAVDNYAFNLRNLEQATEIVPGVPFENLEPLLNQTELYRFEADENEQIYIDVVTTSDASNIEFKVVDSFGQVVGRSTGFRDLEITIPRSGEFTLLIEGWRRNLEADTFTVNVVPVAVTESSLNLGETITGTLATPGAQAVYTFDLADDSLLVFDSLTPTGELLWDLEGPRGIEVENRNFRATDSNGITDPTVAVRAGTYTLTVHANADFVGDFGLVVSNLKDLSNTIPITPNPGSADPNVTISSSILANESRYFRFDAEAGDEFNFVSSVTGSGSVNYKVVDQNGRQVITSTALNSDRSNVVFVEEGTYYLLVEGRIDNATLSEFSFDIEFVQNNGPTLLLGTPLNFNETISGNLAATTDVDSYTFTLNERSLLYFDALTNNGSVRWALTRPAGQVVANRSFNATDSFNNATPVTEIAAGDYRLDISASGGVPLDYQFRLVNLDSAIEIQPGTAFSGELDPANETDLFRFAALAGEEFYFDVQSASDIQNTQYKLIDPFGQVVFISNRLNDRDRIAVDFNGTYTLLVEGWRGNTDVDTYSINVLKAETSDVVLTLGELATAQIANPGDLARFTFSLSERTSVYFDSLSDVSTVLWSLTGPSGTIVESRRFNASDSSSIRDSVLDLPDGDYVLTVDAGGDLTGEYEFILSSLDQAMPIAIGDSVVGQFDAFATQSARWVEGVTLDGAAVAGAIDLSKSSDSIQLPSSVLNGASDFSIEFWYKTTKTGFQTFISGANSSDDNQPLIYLASSTELQIDGVGGWTIDSVADGQWHHYAVTHEDGVGTTFLLDGVSQGTLASTLGTLEIGEGGLFFGQEQDEFGGDFDTTQTADGQLDELRIWNVARSNNQIANNRERVVGNNVAGIRGYWRFDETSGNVAADQTSNGFDASFVSLTPSKATQAYQFDAIDGDVVFFDYLSSSNFNRGAYWRLINPVGIEVFNQALSNDFGPVTLDGGTYTLLVEGLVSETNLNGQFEFDLVGLGNVENPLEPSALVLGETIESEISVVRETDRYRFQLAESSKLYFDSLTNDSSLNWTLKKDGREVISARRFDLSDSNRITNPVLTMRPGDYVLEVTSVEAEPYRFRLLDLSDSIEVELDSPFGNEFESPSQTDIYRFYAVEGERVFVNVINVSNSSRISYRLINERGTVISTQGSLVDQSVLAIPASGEYFLTVEGDYNNTVVEDYQIELVSARLTTAAMGVGEFVSDSIESPGDAFEYSFVLPEKTNLYFDSFTNSSQIVWSLSGPDGEVVRFRRFDQSDAFANSNPVLALTGGDYKLTVAGVGDAFLDFEFQVVELAAAPVVAPGETLVGDLTQPMQTNFYQFDANAGDQFLVDVISATDFFNALYRIVDQDGNVVLERRSLSDAETAEFERSGRYTLLIEGRSGGVGDVTYEIILRQKVVQDGGSVSTGEMINGSVAVPNEEVTYGFSLGSESLIHFDSLTNRNDLLWSLEGPRGFEFTDRPLGQSDSTNTSNTSSVPVSFELLAGDYQLTVRGSGDAVGEFGFRLIDLLDGSQSSLVDNLVAGASTTIVGAQNGPLETSVFRFDLVAGDEVSFATSTNGSINSDYRLLDPFGRQIFRQFLTVGHPAVTADLTGTYYLLVEGRVTNVDPDEYTIVVTHEGNTPVATPIGDALALGAIQNGNLAVDGQVDSYRFSLTERSVLYFDALTNNSNLRWRWTTPRGVEYDNIRFDLSDSFNNNGSGIDVAIPGEYQLDVYAGSGIAGEYSFSISDVQMGTEITPGTSFSGELSTPNETDIYNFEAEAGERFFFDVETTSDFRNTEYKLVDPFGRFVFVSNRLQDQVTTEAEFDGTYSLLVEGAIGNVDVDTYSINVSPVIETIEELPGGQSSSAAIASPGDRAIYTFSVAEDALLFFAPGLADNQFVWSLEDDEHTIVDAQGFRSGRSFIDLAPGDYRLTLSAVNDFVGDIDFFAFIGDGEQLATDGSVTSTNLTSDRGIEIFQFNGTAGEHFALTPDFSLQFTDSVTAQETTTRYIASADPEDGYSGINAALRADVFREGAAVNYILVTDEDRDVAEDDVTFESLFRTLTEQSALLNVVTTSQFRDDTNTRAIGVDSEGAAYIADGAGGFTVGTGGFTTQTNVSFRQDYIDLAWALQGANWDLSLLRAGGASAESFTNAFVDVKVAEILEQTSLQLAASNADVDFDVLAPVGATYEDIVGGETYDFEVRVGNNGRPISYDLIFNQGQTVGSIPVFIIAPYEYGAVAVDADGDSLNWSLVQGPDGLVVDESTGVLMWTAESVVYGEHDVTIRVDDGRGGFDEQTFVLNVNGGDPATISGSVTDFDSITQVTVGAVVPGSSDPYLAGLPDGSLASSGDIAPTHSPVFVDGFVGGLLPGTIVTFEATGGVTFTGAPPADTATPDGDAQPTGTHGNGAENGISNFVAPWNALVGVFLSDDLPTENPAPETLDFSGSGNVEGGIDYASLAPELQQLFFIGDGVNADGTVQEITIPEGATRLFLGTTDGFGWFNNAGAFEVSITASQYTAPADVEFTVFLDENRNGLLDNGERVEVTDEDGNFSFSDVESGSYSVVQQPLEGWQQRTPAGPIEISIEPGEVIDGLFFGNEEVPIVNTNPSITSEPVLSVVAGETYRYQPTIEELDGHEVHFDLPLAPAGMAVNPENGTIRWKPRLDQVGIQNVLLRVRDDFGGFDLQYFQLEVAAPNTAPVIFSEAPTGPAGVGLRYQYKVLATDAEGDQLVFSLSEAPAGVSIDAGSGALNWTPTFDQVGVQAITVVVEDERGQVTSQTFEVAVELEPENVAPEFTSQPPLEARLGDMFLYMVTVFDTNGDPLELMLDEAPDGMSLSPEGLIEWQPNALQLGDNLVRILVADGRGGVATQEFTIDVATQPVNFPPSITSPPLASAVIDTEYRFTPTATDPNGDTLIWTLEESPIGMSIGLQSGQINWTPTIDDLGEHTVVLQVTDTLGAFSQLVYTLRVRAINTPPVILSNPLTTGAVGATYLYQVLSEDVDGDALSIRLDAAPTGMVVDSQNGLIQWTPASGQAGSHDVVVTVTDSAGASISQVFTIEVADGQPNQLPTISSTPSFFTSVGADYLYQVEATDPDGDQLTFELRQAPAGMTIDEATGLLEWNPAAADLGTTIVELIARDPAGAGSIQQFSLTVLEANAIPVITSTPLESLAAGEVFRYDVLATDDNSDFLTYDLVNGPEGMVIDGLGRMFWVPRADQIGINEVQIAVSDGRGGVATQSFNISVEADTTAPQVAILLSDNPVDVGDMVDIRVTWVDNVGVEEVVLTLDGEILPLDLNGIARVQLDNVGTFTAIATATDAAGNSASNEIVIFVGDPNDVDGPTIEITSPTQESNLISGLADVIGSVVDDTLVSYTLSISPAGVNDFRVIGGGTENVEDGVLGSIDTTLLRNGSYVMQLRAVDAGGNVSLEQLSVEVVGETKLGNFQLSFTEFAIPVSGIQVAVTRTYDSLNSDVQGEFGFGWSLDYRDANLQVDLPSSGLEDYGIYTPIAIGTRVYATLPGGQRQGFTFDPDIRVLPGFGANLVLATPRFRPDPGNTATLSVGGGQLLVNEFGELTAGGGVPYNPADPSYGGGYTLTTLDGTRYFVNGTSGLLETATDRNGNKVTFAEDGISTSNGIDIEIERDAAGRISLIRDPNGGEITYAYSAAGDLISVTDREGVEVKYEYDPEREHFLENVIDPLGREGVRTEYDEDGRLLSIDGLDGQGVSFVQDLPGGLTKIIRPDGREEIVKYDDAGNIVEFREANGGVYLYTYNENGATSSTDPLGNVTLFERNANGQLLSTTDPLGNETRFTYNGNGQVTSQIDALGNVTSYQHDENGNIVSITTPSGATLTRELDERGDVLAEVDALGNRTEYTRDENGFVETETKPNGTVVTFERDQLGRETEQTALFDDGTGEDPVEISLVRELDLNGRETKLTDTAGNELTRSFDVFGNLSGTVDQEGRETSYQFVGQQVGTIGFENSAEIIYEYDEFNRVISVTNELGQVESYVYDAIGNLTEKILHDETPEDLSDNPRITFEYDLLRRQTASIDPNGNRTEVKFDEAGNQVESIDALGNSTFFEYDAVGRITKSIAPGGFETINTYDADGLLTKITNADGSTQVFEYDAGGNVLSSVNELGQEIEFEYDSSGNLTAVINPLGACTEYVYDAFDNLVLERDAGGNVTRFFYDTLGQLIRTVQPEGEESSATYLADGRLDTETDYLGQTTSYAYYDDGRLQSRTFDDGDVETFRYDAAGNLLEVEDESGLINQSLDFRGNLTRRTDANGVVVEYGHDLNGNRTSLIVDGEESIYAYDELNRIQSLTDVNGETTTYDYDARGNLVSTEFANGLIETRAYDARSRVTMIKTVNENDETVEQIDYIYDVAGRVSSVDFLDNTRLEYDYDLAGQITDFRRLESGVLVSFIEYEYNAIGNQIRVDRDGIVTVNTFNGNGELISATTDGSVTNYAYDANGNLLREVVDGEVVAEYSWNAKNRLESATSSASGTSTTVNYVYDWSGLRISETIGSETSNFVYDRSNRVPTLLAVTDENNNVQELFHNGYGVVSQSNSEGTQYFLNDVIGSLRTLVDSSGTVLQTNTYDPFGNLSSLTGTDSTRFGFAGEVFDKVTGFTYLRQRYLSNKLGRFVSADPFEGLTRVPLSRQAFQYAYNNPITLTDPTGEFSLTPFQEVMVATAIQAAVGIAVLGIIQAAVGLGGAEEVKWQGPQGSFGVGGTFGVGAGVGAFFTAVASDKSFSGGPQSGSDFRAGFGATLAFGFSAGIGFSAGPGVGGVTLKMGLNPITRFLGGASLTGAYFLADLTAQAGAGETPGSFLIMGFTSGDANGASRGLAVGGTANVTFGFTAAFGVRIEEADRADFINFTDFASLEDLFAEYA